MGQIANIIDFQAVRRTKMLTATLAAQQCAGFSPLARLMPGVSDPAWTKYPDTDSSEATHASDRNPRSSVLRVLIALLPPCFERFEPAMLVPAASDLAIIMMLFAAGRVLVGTDAAGVFRIREICVYLASFFVCSQMVGLYSTRRRDWLLEIAAVVRTSFWASLFACFALGIARGSALYLPTFAFSAGTVSALIARRWLRDRVWAHDPLKNVLVVGSGTHAQKLANSIRFDQSSGRTLKGIVAENHMRNVYGGAMLSRIAREEFIDEIIVASNDRKVIETAIQQAGQNLLDVRLSPDMPSVSGEIAVEKIGDVFLFKVRDHQPPAYTLAAKRLLDLVSSISGLVALLPVLLLIALLIKLDSRGPVLYRARRVGRKGRVFCCYKFRTMVPEADAVKDSLRSLNERKGAFFKIDNDPRVTSIGSFLRRFSLDELPQLWNVFVGDMSLVGPRPHPLDDASRYQIHHLQRLDFVPGITGLWQVTARRDPSFERSVALDVEYIKRWSLGLDLRILWRTISVVLEGSGA